MKLQADRRGAVRFIDGGVFVSRFAQKFRVILNEDSVMKNRHVTRLDYSAMFIEAWSVVDDVVGLPFARLATGVDEGWLGLVERCCLTIEIRLVIV